MRIVFLPLMGLCLLVANCQPVFPTSDQIEMTEPTLVATDRSVHGTAFFGAAPGGKPFNTAGNLGATFHLGAWGNGALYFNGDVWTWVKHASGNRFEPKRLIYTLEPGYYRENGKSAYRFFIRHQSFHDVDFFGGENEAYELYGASLRHAGKPQVYIQVGKYLNKRVVDYGWDFAGSLTFDLPPWGKKDTYLELWAHHVTGKRASRDGFTDYAAEFGVQYRSGITLFGRYESLHDIDRFLGKTDHHVLTGIRYNW